MKTRLAVVVSHPIQHFAPWHREVAQRNNVDLKVLFCCDWGVTTYRDPDFGVDLAWDVPLLDGYDHQFLPIARRPEQLSFRSVDNPTVGAALDAFRPDVVKLFGYAYATTWRVAAWARRRRVPVLLYSDSNASVRHRLPKRAIKALVVGGFYRFVDGAMFVGDNNRRYHQRYGLPDERLFEGMLPVDVKRLLGSVPDVSEARTEVRRQLNIPQNSRVVVFSGKLIARKRAEDLIYACGALCRAGLLVDAILLGDGPDKALLQQLAADVAPGRVHFVGFVNQRAIGRYYAAADALAVPSSYDPHPLVVTEGSSFGLPVLASDKLGCIGDADTVRPSQNSLIHRCGDVVGLAANIRCLIENDELRRSLAGGARQIALGQDVSVAAERLEVAAERLRVLGKRRLVFD